MKSDMPPPLPLENLSHFKWWRLQKPNSAKLLKEVVFLWRASSGRVPGKVGPWAVYSRQEWQKRTGQSRNQLDRALADLEEMKLVQREVHRFAGTKTYAFLQPTPLAIRYMGKDTDLGRLEDSWKKTAEKITAQTEEVTEENPVDALAEKSGEKTGEQSDHTSFPSNPSKTKFLKGATQSSTSEVKGKAGKKLEKGAPPQTAQDVNESVVSGGSEAVPAPPGATGDEIDQMWAASKQKKREKLLKKFPHIEGVNEYKLTHPIDLYHNWEDFSLEVQTKNYAKYVGYSKNSMNKKSSFLT